MKFFEGKILSVRGQTVAVTVSRVFKHPRFKKYIVKRSKALVHLNLEDAPKLNCENGDLVLLERTRPISKRKHSVIVFNKTKGIDLRSVSI